MIDQIIHYNLIKIQPKHRDFFLFIPKNQLWTFSENIYYEQNVVYWFVKLLKAFNDKIVFYDIGANVGYYSFEALDFSSHIFAFEPTRKTQKILKMNVHKNKAKRIKIIGKALSNTEGSFDFFIYNAGGNNSLIERNIPEDHELKKTSIRKVPVTTLDKWTTETGQPLPSIMKIDVEGAELSVLLGAQKTIKKSKPYIFIEYSASTCNDAGYKREEICKLLTAANYKIRGLSGDNVSRKLLDINKRASVTNLVAYQNTVFNKKVFDG